jgi:hypothetical protein
MANPKLKSEHGGAKNGGGYWGTRYDAKKYSKKERRLNSKKEVSEQVKGK